MNRFAGLLLLSCFVSGCGIIYGAAGAVALTGYTVYKGGEIIVVSTKEAVTSGFEDAEAVMFADGELKTQCPANVQKVYQATAKVLEDLKFSSIRGDHDALSGTLKARTHDREKIVVKLERVDDGNTSFNLKIGRRGDLKNSEMIYDHTVAMINVLNSLEAAQQQS